MLKIVYRICCGMDVHKSFVVACIATTNDHGVTNYKSKRFSTFTGDLRRCAVIALLHIQPVARRLAQRSPRSKRETRTGEMPKVRAKAACAKPSPSSAAPVQSPG